MFRTLTLALVLVSTGVLAQPAPDPHGLSPSQIASAAPAADWVAIPAADLLVMDLAPTAKSRSARVIIQLLPAPFSQGWVGNLRKLAAVHWWDGTSVYRVQDNYVAQWGDGEDDKANAKALPPGLAVMPEADYLTHLPGHRVCDRDMCRTVPEFVSLWSQSMPDVYAPGVGFGAGWPIGFGASADAAGRTSAWPLHCYGMVGVARDLSPDTGTGAELYAVIGQAPRHLDRNIALVGRVVEGIDTLASLPRGPVPMGVYADRADHTPIERVRLASDLPADQQPHLQYLSTTSASFARYVQARANRHDGFFLQPAGGVDICAVMVPIRRGPGVG